LIYAIDAGFQILLPLSESVIKAPFPAFLYNTQTSFFPLKNGFLLFVWNTFIFRFGITMGTENIKAITTTARQGFKILFL
jgi:hypothetical protein